MRPCAVCFVSICESYTSSAARDHWGAFIAESHKGSVKADSQSSCSSCTRDAIPFKIH